MNRNNRVPQYWTVENTRRESQSSRRLEAAHTLAETMVAAGIIGFMVISLYAGITSGFDTLRITRENLRATQILQEKMEVIRLIKWENVAPGFIPTNFTEPFFPNDTNNPGLTYNGAVTISDPGLSETYANHIRMVRVDLSWTSGNVLRTRQMTTYVSQDGLQNYIY